MLIVYPRVDDRYADASAKVTFLTKLVNSSHDMRIVISFVACSVTALDAVVGTAADGRAMGNSRDFSLWLMELPNRGYLLHNRPRGDLLDNNSLILVVVKQGERTTIEKSEGQIMVESGGNAVIFQGRKETGGRLQRVQELLARLKQRCSITRLLDDGQFLHQ